MNLTKKQKLGLGISLAAIAGFIYSKFAKANQNTNNGNNNTGGGNNNTGGGGTGNNTTDVLTAAYKAAVEALYLKDIITKGIGYATMQKRLSLEIPKNGQGFYPNYQNLMIISSGNNVNLRLEPSLRGEIIKKISKDDGIGKTTGKFFNKDGNIWAEITLIPPIKRPVPYNPITIAYVATQLAKSESTILNGIKLIN